METPSKEKLPLRTSKHLSTAMHCDSPFRTLPNVSTPPSRFAKILNPFEQHLLDRLHLPTFSPGVFTQNSTPKSEEKFKWTIDEISSLKPADIDVDTISQHVSDHDPTMESIVQEKIEKFFSEKAIAPSPFNEQIKQGALIQSPVEAKLVCTTTSCQTLLSLPPILPRHVEEVLAPYFQYEEGSDIDPNASLYRRLFEFGGGSPVASSPPLSTGLSPLQFSPDFNGKLENMIEMPELRDCTLSPIGRIPSSKDKSSKFNSRSACRLNFSSHMSVDASLVVPDVHKTLNLTSVETGDCLVDERPDTPPAEVSHNWDMEYKQISILVKTPPSSPDAFYDSDTPHSKIFTSQRKRLSHSFKREEEMEVAEVVVEKVINRESEIMESGYQTGGCENSAFMFASTPTKNL